MPLRKGEITPQRLARLHDQVAPLVVQGVSTSEIARRLGVSRVTAAKDVAKVQEIWVEEVNNSRDSMRGQIHATYKWMLAEIAEQWSNSKNGRKTVILNPDGTQLVRIEPPDQRWMSGMLAVAKECSTMLGIREGVDTVSRIEVPEATRSALAPMSTDSYMAMLATTGGLSGINAVPPVHDRKELEPVEPVEVDCLDQLSETDPQSDADAPVGSQPPEQRREYVGRWKIPPADD